MEKRLELMEQPEEKPEPVTESEREQILELADRLAQPEISREIRMGLVNQLRLVLKGNVSTFQVSPARLYELPLLEHPPPV